MKRFNLLQMLQSIGRSLMIPIAMLPAAGILLAFGVSFQDPNIVASLPFLGTDGLVHVLKLMRKRAVRFSPTCRCCLRSAWRWDLVTIRALPGCRRSPGF